MNMKKGIKELVFLLFRLVASLSIYLHKPTIIAITGNVGKTTTKDMTIAILAQAGLSVRGSRDSYNSQIGVPLSILGVESGLRNPFQWLLSLLRGVWNALFTSPKFLVLEMGLDAPGDIADLVRVFSLDRALVTRLSRDPVHAANFQSTEALYKEKMLLFQGLKEDGIGFYNNEDFIQKEYLPKKLNRNLQPFPSKSIYLKNMSIHYDDEGNPVGTDVVLSLRGNDETFYIPDTLGEGAVNALIASITLVESLDNNVSVSTIRRAIASRNPTPGRMRILHGKNGSSIIDDSYNSSPIAMEKALDVLSLLEAKKKVLILGKMGELRDEEDVHKRLGVRVSDIADVVLVCSDVSYGEHHNVQYFSNNDALIQEALHHLDKGVIFLCKGSQVSRMEIVVKAILEERDIYNRESPLVRQGKGWQ